MKKNIIAVCDTEGEYACNFAEYLNSRKKVPFEAEAFTDVEKLCTYAGHNPPEILLIAEGDVDEQIEKLGAENVILLSEEKQQEQEGHKTVYKYQSAESVIQEVMAYYVEHTSPVSDAVNSRKLDMIGIYSPVKPCLLSPQVRFWEKKNRFSILIWRTIPGLKPYFIWKVQRTSQTFFIGSDARRHWDRKRFQSL